MENIATAVNARNTIFIKSFLCAKFFSIAQIPIFFSLQLTRRIIPVTGAPPTSNYRRSQAMGFGTQNNPFFTLDGLQLCNGRRLVVWLCEQISHRIFGRNSRPEPLRLPHRQKFTFSPESSRFSPIGPAQCNA